MESSGAKRALDILVSAVGLAAMSPLLLVVGLAIWLRDFHSPLYIAPRVARGGGTFRMVKFRSMSVSADRTGVDSTGANDARITAVGHVIRRYKLDELPQLWNVLTGAMSLVGPRPQVMREVKLYTPAERELLTVRPGITDLASVVFADEGKILEHEPDPDRAYNQLIRPWKSRLGILYVRHVSVRLDVELIALTIVALVSRQRALNRVSRILARLDADDRTRQVALRQARLVPAVPPGTAEIVRHR